MQFEHQHLLWVALAATVGLGLFFWWAWRTRQRLIAQFVRSRLLANLTVGISTGRQKSRLALLVAAVALAIAALARPQWGFDWEEARQRGLDVVVAIDTSRSMLAVDIPPSRLARAKLAALDLKRLARADRVGLVAFAGSAFLQCPLSFDDEAFRQSVNALDVGIIPVGGSAIAEAIETARAAFKEKNDNYKILVLFTDGEDNDGRAVETAQRAAKDGMRIFTIGVGTANGELLRITDAKGRTDYVRDDQGNVIKSRLNEQLLKDVALASQGHYMLLAGADTMKVLYDNALAPLPKTEHTARRIKRFHERYQWLLGAALVLLCVEMLLPERKRARQVATAIPSDTVLKAAAALVMAFYPMIVLASPASAVKKYKTGRYEAALKEYEALLAERPNQPHLHFNAGAAAFQTTNYQRALHHFNSALIAEDLRLQQKAHYNLGNTLFRVGENEGALTNKQQLWKDAMTSYQRALKLNPKDADALFNLEFVKDRIAAIEAGHSAKRAADKALAEAQYARALEIMEHQDPIMQEYYKDYIENLRELNKLDEELTRKLKEQLEKSTVP
jgi:Ca-activated chloride channel family protein